MNTAIFNSKPMFKEIWKKLWNNNFIRSNGILFIANIINGTINFGIIFFAEAKLSKSNFALWVAISGVLAVFQGPISGLSTHLVRKIANLDHDNQKVLSSYYSQFKVLIFKIFGILLILSPALGWLVNNIFNYQDLYSSWLVMAYISFQLLLSLNQQILLGRLKIWRYVTSLLTYGFTRLTLTVGLVLVGFGVPTLPLAMLLAAILAFTLGEILTKPVLSEIDEKFKDQDSAEKKYELKPWQELHSTFWTGSVLQLLLIFMNLGVLTGKSFLDTDSLYSYSLAYSFGQIVHFGASSALGTFVANSARKHDKKLYLKTLGVMMGLSLVISAFVVSAIAFGRPILEYFNKLTYFDNLKYIALFLIFTIFYNAIYVTIQYLLSRSAFKKSGVLAIFVLLQFAILFIFNQLGLETIWTTIWTSIISAALGAITLIYLAITWKIDPVPENDAIEEIY